MQPKMRPRCKRGRVWVDLIFMNIDEIFMNVESFKPDADTLECMHESLECDHASLKPVIDTITKARLQCVPIQTICNYSVNKSARVANARE
ncbi:MAG: hypothetical protein IH595_02375 [Bacteroidales bacterium]|nr:hypothetical protein [Bacteroidales bacterium]